MRQLGFNNPSPENYVKFQPPIHFADELRCDNDSNILAHPGISIADLFVSWIEPDVFASELHGVENIPLQQENNLAGGLVLMPGGYDEVRSARSVDVGTENSRRPPRPVSK